MADPVVAAIEIGAPPDRVFAYFVEPERMVRWMGEFARLDPRPGGDFAADIRGVPVRGRYVEVDPPHRLVIAWGHAGSDRLPPGASTVEVSLRPAGSGTRVEVVHSRLPEPDAAGHRRGWEHFLGRLALAASGADPGEDALERDPSCPPASRR